MHYWRIRDADAIAASLAAQDGKLNPFVSLIANQDSCVSLSLQRSNSTKFEAGLKAHAGGRVAFDCSQLHAWHIPSYSDDRCYSVDIDGATTEFEPERAYNSEAKFVLLPYAVTLIRPTHVRLDRLSSADRPTLTTTTNNNNGLLTGEDMRTSVLHRYTTDAPGSWVVRSDSSPPSSIVDRSAVVLIALILLAIAQAQRVYYARPEYVRDNALSLEWSLVPYALALLTLFGAGILQNDARDAMRIVVPKRFVDSGRNWQAAAATYLPLATAIALVAGTMRSSTSA